ncbi:hypothetical protein [Deinococcus sp.]|uniref:hypothetical protein n=1 Tax=Deinococcus sp. TaxID=47478 RepID=UPI003CC57D94
MDDPASQVSARTVEALLASPLLTPATRQALAARLEERPGDFKFFGVQEGALLEAVSVLLVPHDPARMSLARRIDARLMRGDTDGWRYDSQPPDAQAYRALLSSLPADFLALDESKQTAALVQAQRQHPRSFEDLLAELTEGYYADPRAQVGIGYVGFADALGWQQTGLDSFDPNEDAAWQTLGREQP